MLLDMLTGPAQKAGLVNYAIKLLNAFGSGLKQDQQEWLIKNLEGLPSYLETKEGAEVMRAVVDCYKSHINRK